MTSCEDILLSEFRDVVLLHIAFHLVICLRLESWLSRHVSNDRLRYCSTMSGTEILDRLLLHVAFRLVVWSRLDGWKTGRLTKRGGSTFVAYRNTLANRLRLDDWLATCLKLKRRP